VRRRGTRGKVPTSGERGGRKGQKVIQILSGGKIRLQKEKEEKTGSGQEEDLPNWEETKNPQEFWLIRKRKVPKRLKRLDLIKP
jgi:hypothetical protein